MATGQRKANALAGRAVRSSPVQRPPPPPIVPRARKPKSYNEDELFGLDDADGTFLEENSPDSLLGYESSGRLRTSFCLLS